MWVRKRIDIEPRDLMYGMRRCLAPGNRERVSRQIHDYWTPEQTFVCLSVRSGFDLLLNAVNWPPGSEVLLTGMTIPDMPKIVRQNGLVPVGLDIDAERMSVSADQLRRATTPRTKAIVVAHLFGGLSDLEPVLEVAHEHNLLVIEDCAQAYVGRHYQGNPRADVSMFSFGAIKTNTALCGGVFLVRRQDLLARLRRMHARWPVQSRLTFFKRLIKYSGVKLISRPFIAGTIARSMRWLGRDHDQLAVRLSRGFSGGDFFRRIRCQPSTPLLSLMERKFSRFDEHRIVRRTQRGWKLERALRASVDVLGSRMDRPTYWVFPILVEDPQGLVEHLWKHGFDATNSCSMQSVNDVVMQASDGQESREELDNVAFLLRHVVFLPFDLSMPAKELRRMAQVIRAYQPRRVELPPALDRVREGAADLSEAAQHLSS